MNILNKGRKNMKKRIISMLLVLALAIGCLSMIASADNTFWYEDFIAKRWMAV
jgi:hypothetical protein